MTEFTFSRLILLLKSNRLFQLPSVIAQPKTLCLRYVLALWWKALPDASGNSTNHVCPYPCSPEVQSILKISQPQEPELMNANPSPPVSRFYSVKHF